MVPVSQGYSSICHFSQSIIFKQYQKIALLVLEIILNLETDEIEAKASHLKPKVITL